MSISFAIQGFAALQRNLAKTEKKLINAENAALYKKGNIIIADAKKMCPVDTGRLRDTGYAGPPTGFPAVVETGFGTDYGLYVHEDLTARHPTGEALFLWKALQLHTSDFQGWMAKQTQQYFQLGVGVSAVQALVPKKMKDKGPRKRKKKKKK